MVEIQSYITESEAETYFNSRLHAEAWDSAQSVLRVKALKSATRMIDRLNFRGSVPAGQVQQWPRIMQAGRAPIIPQDIQIAVCELALNLLDGVDPDMEEELIGSVADAYSTVRNTSDPTVYRDYIKAGIPSAEAWKHLLPYLNDPQALRLTRRG